VHDRQVEREAAAVSVDDRGFRYGDAAFETCRGYGGTVFAWDRHHRGLRQTCETLGTAEAVPEDLTGRIEATLAPNDLSEAYLRVSVSRGPGKLSPAEAVDPKVVVNVEPLP
jgi:branched-chain amino acid aminotransferase